MSFTSRIRSKIELEEWFPYQVNVQDIPTDLESVCKERPDGTRHWTQHFTGRLHRLDGPAVEHPDGTREWYQYGDRHRTAGPAIEYADGSLEWCQQGLMHRTDGPAAEYVDGVICWCLRGVHYSFEAWLDQTDLSDEEKLMILLKYG